VLASAGRIDEAERAIQLNALLLAFDYTLRKQAMARDVSFDSHQASAQNGRHGVLALWAFQDSTLLLHLGAITMLKEGTMDRLRAFLDSQNQVFNGLSFGVTLEEVITQMIKDYPLDPIVAYNLGDKDWLTPKPGGMKNLVAKPALQMFITL